MKNMIRPGEREHTVADGKSKVEDFVSDFLISPVRLTHLMKCNVCPEYYFPCHIIAFAAAYCTCANDVKPVHGVAGKCGYSIFVLVKLQLPAEILVKKFGSAKSFKPGALLEASQLPLWLCTTYSGWSQANHSSLVKMWHDHYFHHPCRFLQSHQLPSSFLSNQTPKRPSESCFFRILRPKTHQNSSLAMSGSANPRFLRFLADVAMDVTTPRGASLVLGAVLVPWGDPERASVLSCQTATKAINYSKST